MLHKKWLVIIGASVLLVFASCRLVSLSDATTPPIEQLALVNGEISNWNPDVDIKIYVGDKVYDLMDGGAPQYLEKGLIKTGFQTFKGPNDGNVQVTIFDFGKDAKANIMFEEKRIAATGSTVKDFNYLDSVVVLKSVLGGVNCFAHFYNFCFEINVTGFSDQVLAIKIVDLFLGLYEKKLKPS